MVGHVTFRRGAEKLWLHNVGQFRWFESAFFGTFSHNLRLVLSHHLYASKPAAVLRPRPRKKWEQDELEEKFEKSSKQAEDTSKEEAREVEGNRGRGGKTDLLSRQIEVRTRKEGRGWRRWWVIERGKHSILLTSLEDVDETWAQPWTGHRSAALSNIGGKHTRAHTLTRCLAILHLLFFPNSQNEKPHMYTPLSNSS